MKQKITLKQIAKELDVSISTVSKALKDSKEIGEETKKKIQAFAKTFTAVLNKDQTTFSKFVKTNKTVQKAKDYVRNPAKAFSDFSGAWRRYAGLEFVSFNGDRAQ